MNCHCQLPANNSFILTSPHPFFPSSLEQKIVKINYPHLRRIKISFTAMWD